MPLSCCFVAQGEYPLASASAVERAQSNQQATGVVQERGKEVVLTFSMQGACEDGH